MATGIENAGCFEPGALILNEFKVESCLGIGGVGEVYLVRSRSTGLRFAVKTLLPEIVNDHASKRLFIRELRTWMELPFHANITACRFFRTVKDRLAVFSEYVDGGSLARQIGLGKVSDLERILDIAIQLIRGIGVAHSRDVIHQDIKPDNVLLTREGVAKLTDFGMARAFHRKRSENPLNPETAKSILLTGTGMTRAYCSPEQASGEKVRRATDIWSFGVTVMEMFAGEMAWMLGVMADQILDQLTGAGRSVLLAVPMPDSVKTILKRCFMQDPGDRWSSCNELESALVSVYERETGQPYTRQATDVLDLTDDLDLNLNREVPWRDPLEYIHELAAMIPVDVSHCERLAAERTGSWRSRDLIDLELFVEMGDIFAGKTEIPEVSAKFTEMLFDRARVHEFIEDFNGGIDIFKQVIEMLSSREPFPGRIQIQVSALIELAELEMRIGNCDESELCYERGLDLLDDAGETGVDMKILEGKLKYGKAGVKWHIGEFRDALVLNREAMDLLNGLINKTDTPDLQLNLGRCKLTHGIIHRSLGNVAEAVDLYDQAITILENPPEGVTGRKWRVLLAHAYRNKANGLNNLGEHQDSFLFHDKSIAIRKELLTSEARSVNIEALATEYMNKAVSLRFGGFLKEALAIMEEAFLIKEQLVTLMGRTDLTNDLAGLMMNQAVNLIELHEYEKGIVLLDRAIDIKKRLIEEEGRSEIRPELAMVLVNKGIVLGRLDREAEGLAVTEEAIEIREDLYFRENRKEIAPGLAALYMNKAVSLNLMNRASEALSLLNKAESMLLEVMDEHSASVHLSNLTLILVNRANCYFLGLNQPQKSLEDFHKARDIRWTLIVEKDRLDQLGAYARGQQYLADAYLALNETDLARDALKDAIYLLEKYNLVLNRDDYREMLVEFREILEDL